MLILLVLVSAAIFLRWIHPFLATSVPVEAGVLVVEGWVPDHALQAAVQEFDRGGYSMVYVTGGPLARGAPLSEYKTFAALGEGVMEHFGAPENRVQSVPAPKVRRDRTYASALALRDWLEAHDGLPDSLNVVTVGAHSRRTRLMYETAFGDGCEIGVISIEDDEYDPRCWWSYSQGVRTVMSETAAYLYARLLFRVSADREMVQNASGEDPVESSP